MAIPPDLKDRVALLEARVDELERERFWRGVWRAFLDPWRHVRAIRSFSQYLEITLKR